jgi:hypothetical protein
MKKLPAYGIFVMRHQDPCMVQNENDNTRRRAWYYKSELAIGYECSLPSLNKMLKEAGVYTKNAKKVYGPDLAKLYEKFWEPDYELLIPKKSDGNAA